MKLSKLREIEKLLSRVAFQDHPSGLSAKDLKMKSEGLIHKFFDPSGKVEPVYFPNGIPESKIQHSLEESYGVKLKHENLEHKMNSWAEKNATYRDGELSCSYSELVKTDEGWKRIQCNEPPIFIDKKGLVWCQMHGERRKSTHYCRKLKPSELKSLKEGKPVDDIPSFISWVKSKNFWD